MTTVHIFLDNGGIFSTKTINFIEKIEPNKHFYYFVGKKKIHFKNVKLIKSEKDFFFEISKGNIGKIVFHSLHYYQFKLIDKIRNTHPGKVLIAWMFWSYEYYQLPFNLKYIYGKFSSRLLLRKRTFLFSENFRHYLKGNVSSPFLITEKKYNRLIQKVDQFYSFIQDDYIEIYKSDSKTEYHFLPYLDISDVVLNQKKNGIADKIMVGHNGSPLLNHYEILASIKKYPGIANSEILIPLTYGKKIYIENLKAQIAADFSLNITYLEKHLPLNEYYSILSNVSVFLLNSYCQQGLGNVAFFLQNGTTVYLSEKSSTYRFLVKNGFIIFSTESLDDSSSLYLLSENEKQVNKTKMEELISVPLVQQRWKKLISN